MEKKIKRKIKNKNENEKKSSPPLSALTIRLYTGIRLAASFLRILARRFME